MPNKKPVILHITESLGVGGTEMLLRDTVPALNNYRNILIHLSEPNCLSTFFAPGTEVICLNYKGKSDVLRVVNAIRKIIREREVDLIHSHLFMPTLLTRLANKKQVPHIFSIHSPLSVDAFEVNKLSLWAERLTYSGKQSLIAVSDAVLQDYRTHIRVSGKAQVLYNFVADNYLQQTAQPRSFLSSPLRLVAVGTLKTPKNYTQLIKAMALLPQGAATLDIYGSGALHDELNQLIQATSAPATLKGRADNIAQILPQYDAYIMASIYEGFGIAPMEAMAVGLPVLLSDIPVFREVAGDRPVYFNPADPDDVAQKIQEVIADWPAVVEKSAGNKKLIAENFSFGSYIVALNQIYQSHLSSR